MPFASLVSDMFGRVESKVRAMKIPEWLPNTHSSVVRGDWLCGTQGGLGQAELGVLLLDV